MRNIVRLGLLLACLLASGQLTAQVYLGGIYGTTNPSNTGDDSTFPEVESDAGFRIYLGNQLSEKFSFEFAYLNMGEYEVGTADGIPDAQEVEDTISIVGYEASFVGKLPLRRNFAVFARLGAYQWEGERSIIENVVLDGNTAEQETLSTFDEFDYTLGLGIEYELISNFGLTIEANQYKTDDVLNNMYGAGFFFSF